MDEKRKIPFPQANDFSKVLKIIAINDVSKLEDQAYLKDYLNVGTERQLGYYFSACEFLGLIDKNKCLTPHAKYLKSLSFQMYILELIKLIVSKPVFGEVFFLEFINGAPLTKDDISQLISDIYEIDNLSVCDRRASTVRNWVDWIKEQKTSLTFSK